jgi:hypothetical protein
MQFSEIKKAVINVVTVLVTVTPWILRAMEVEPFKGTAVATAVSSILGIVGVIAHYLVPNTTTDASKVQTQSVAYKPDVNAQKVVAKSRRRKVDATAAAAPHPHPKKKPAPPADPPAAAGPKGSPVI